jgi:hypothetical protein
MQVKWGTTRAVAAATVEAAVTGSASPAWPATQRRVPAGGPDPDEAGEEEPSGD